MRIKRKTVNMLLLSEREIEILFNLAERARTGQTVHAAEEEVAPGQFFGIAVAPEHDSMNHANLAPMRCRE